MKTLIDRWGMVIGLLLVFLTMPKLAMAVDDEANKKILKEVECLQLRSECIIMRECKVTYFKV